MKIGDFDTIYSKEGSELPGYSNSENILDSNDMEFLDGKSVLKSDTIQLCDGVSNTSSLTELGLKINVVKQSELKPYNSLNKLKRCTMRNISRKHF